MNENGPRERAEMLGHPVVWPSQMKTTFRIS